MTLPTSAISMSQVNTELGLSSTQTISFNDSGVRYLTSESGIASGGGSSGTTNSMYELLGKAYVFQFNMPGGYNLDLYTAAINAGWNGSRPLIAVVPPGTIIGSTSTGSPALTIQNSFPRGVTLINQGFIVGAGGAGGNSQWINASINNGAAAQPNSTPLSSTGGDGGPALSVSVAVTIQNNGIIGGGGGGGGSAIVGDHVYWTLVDGEGGGGAGSVPGSGGLTYGSWDQGNGRWYQGGGYYSMGGTNAAGGSLLGGLGSTGQYGYGQRQSTYSFLNGQGTVQGYSCSGGTGGGLGRAGGSGTSNSDPGSNKSGGAGGAAVLGSGYVSWSVYGSVYGALA
jgi:hypothetical protein